MSPSPKRGRPVAVEPNEVLDRAVALFCAQGVETLSLNQLCAELGISKPALYRSFGGEDGLRRAALARYFELWMGPALARMDFTQPFAAQCAQLAKLVCHPDLQSPQTHGCYYARLRLSRSSLGEQSLALLKQLETGTRAQLQAWMEGVARSGQLKPDLTAASAAAYLDAQIMLATIQRGQGEDPAEIESRMRLALSVLSA